MDLKILGIRHHGPGSARAAVKALQSFVPDILLVEAPTEMQALLPFILDKDLKPPVAGLIFNPKDLQEAQYLPFANFSPEYQGLKWALKKDIPCRCIDLPLGKQMALENENSKTSDLAIFQIPQKKGSDEITNDPLGYLAKIAGYEDRERWWEVYFEQPEHEDRIFEAILELMTHLREQSQRNEDPETLLREAHMREGIRKAHKDGHEKIAVICGAWHTPVLAQVDQYKASQDKSLLRGLPSIKCTATWIPWSYQQLAQSSGYSAGVESPEWYHLLFQNRTDAPTRWLTKAGRLLRQKKISSSAAHIIEAVRLTTVIANMRGLSIPGLQELEEAAVATLCKGNPLTLDLIRQHLVVGFRSGKVPKSIPVIPFQKDLEKLIKSTRLKKYRETNEAHWLKGTEDKPKGGIDLREPTDLAKSHLLHRLNILNIPWGHYETASERDLGGFKEYWKLQWKSSFAMRIIEAGMWGNTVLTAANQFIMAESKKADRLKAIANYIQQALLADLPQTLDQLTKHLANAAATTTDIPMLLELLQPLIQSLRYGSVRQMDIRGLEAIIISIIPRICIGLPLAAQQRDEESSRAFQEQIFAANQAIGLLEDPAHHELWVSALEKLSQAFGVHTLLLGFASRLLYDKQLINASEAQKRLSFGLSKAQSKSDAAYWIEGFLFGSGQLIIHQRELWATLDAWLQTLDAEDFKAVLPLLRRSFTEFSTVERQRMMELASGTSDTDKEGGVDLDAERANEVSAELGFLWNG